MLFYLRLAALYHEICCVALAAIVETYEDDYRR